MHCAAKKNLEAVINSGNHVLDQVKTNQHSLFEDCMLTSNHMKPDNQFIAPVEKGSNRIRVQISLDI